MCLKLKRNKLYTTTKDKVVYKVLIKYNFSTNSYYTPFRKVIIEFHKMYNSALRIDNFNNEYSVNIGIHSFKRKNDAIKLIESSNYFNYKSFFIAKCIIPKGSRYYNGTFSVSLYNIKNLKSIASDKIKYIKVIKS